METFFIGDTHFGHKNIIKYESEARPFSSIEEMNEELIKRWNNTVRPKDRVIHVGDFCFGAANIVIAGRLNGQKTLVMGNHDTYPTDKYLKHFAKVLGCLEFDNNIVTHIPVHQDQFDRYSYNIHGHLHSKYVMVMPPACRGWVLDRRYINVSCEHINLTPISYDAILSRP